MSEPEKSALAQAAAATQAMLAARRTTSKEPEPVEPEPET